MDQYPYVHENCSKNLSFGRCEVLNNILSSSRLIRVECRSDRHGKVEEVKVNRKNTHPSDPCTND